MAGMICTNGRYKVDGAFVASSSVVSYTRSSDGTTTTTYGWYSSEAGGWLANAGVGKSENPAALGVTATVVDGAKVYPNSNLDDEGSYETCRTANLYAIVKSVSGGGSVGLSSGTLYGDRYIEGGTSATVSVTSTPTGKSLTEFTVNGESVSGTSKTIASVAGDISVYAKFTYDSYSVVQPSASNGTVAVYVNGTKVSSFPASVSAGGVVRYVCTPSSGYSFSYIDIDGSRSASADTSVTVERRTDDQTINATAHFSSSEVIVNTITKTGSGSFSVLDSDGNAVTVNADNTFSCFRYATYRIVSTPASGNYLEGVYESERKVSSSTDYEFTQGGANCEFSIVFASGSGKGIEVVKCGSASSATDATWNGCSLSWTSSGDEYTFSPSAASGYSFVRLYIEDLGMTGKGCVVESADIGNPVTIDFRAKVVGIFKSDSEPAEPDDEDQGNATHEDSVSVGEWEGGVSRMTATWKSRRNVFAKPVAFSCARVYCDEYGSSSPHLGVLQYQSPSKTDVAYNKVSVIVPSQNAIRLVAHRPEKYSEVEVVSSSQVLEVDVGTSMEALCQNT